MNLVNNITESELRSLLLADKESEHLEFKEAKDSFNFENGRHSLLGYCIALANEGGGKLILGVDDNFPRNIVGTKAYGNVDKLGDQLYNKLRRRIGVQELLLKEGRVVVINIPARPIGYPLEFDGAFLMRQNDQLLPMSNEILQKIYAEKVNDHTESILDEVTFDDLDPQALVNLRFKLKESGRVETNIDNLTDLQLLKDLRLLNEDGFTLAAIILLGKKSTIEKYFPYSEVRYAYRISDSHDIQYQEVFRDAYLLYSDLLWERIDSRNLTINIQLGLNVVQKKAFNEKSIREAINNSIIHRDYSEKQSVIIFQTNDYISLTSPGGFLDGVSIQNILDASKPRNKLLADVLYKCGYVESLGSGVNTMYKNQLSLGKEPPDYTDSDKYNVRLRLSAKIDDLEFAKYVLRIAHKLGKDLSDAELITLKNIKNSSLNIKTREVDNLKKLALVETNYKGEYILSKEYYIHSESRAEYIKKKGISKIRAKEMIGNFLKEYDKGTMADFESLLDVTRPTIHKYLVEMKAEGIIEFIGNPRISRGKDRSYWQLKNL